MRSPLVTTVLFHLGPVPVSETVVVTWGLMALLALGSMAATRRLSLAPSRLQTVLESVVEAVNSQIRDTMRGDPRTLPRADRHALSLHPRVELVVARRRASIRRRRISKPMRRWRRSCSRPRSITGCETERHAADI